MARLILHVNGAVREVEVAPSETLLSVLRDTLDLTGTKYGCGEGQCGACTVLLDGRAVRSCQVRASAVTNKSITTIESLEHDGPLRHLHALREAFLSHDAMQCGYCTPGMIMAAAALLTATPHPTDEEIIAAMNGNLCRCGTYPRIVAAIRDAEANAAGTGRGR